MCRHICTAALICVAIAGCAAKQSVHDTTTWEPARTFSGRYVFGFEVSEFTPTGRQERWWLGGEIGPITNRLVAPVGEKPAMHSPVFVTVEGQLSSPGRHGHLGQYIRELRVTRVISVRQSH